MQTFIKIIIIAVYISYSFPNTYSQTLTPAQVYNNVSGSVVVILTYDSRDELTSQGSGVIINDEGYLVTNYHVIEFAKRIEVIYNDETISYTDIIGIDVERVQEILNPG